MILGFFIGNTLFLIFLIFHLKNQVDKFSSKSNPSDKKDF